VRPRGHEAAPIIAENTMFVVTPYPNILYAIDLTKPGGRPFYASDRGEDVWRDQLAARAVAPR
jgi:glucose dehydrogenase